MIGGLIDGILDTGERKMFKHRLKLRRKRLENIAEANTETINSNLMDTAYHAMVKIVVVKALNQVLEEENVFTWHPPTQGEVNKLVAAAQAKLTDLRLQPIKMWVIDNEIQIGLIAVPIFADREKTKMTLMLANNKIASISVNAGKPLGTPSKNARA